MSNKKSLTPPSKPQKVLITRLEPKTNNLFNLIKQHHYQPISLPLIKKQPLAEKLRLVDVLIKQLQSAAAKKNLANSSLLIFTSQQSFELFANYLIKTSQLTLLFNQLAAGISFATVGKVLADHILNFCQQQKLAMPDIIYPPNNYSAEALLKTIKNLKPANKKFNNYILFSPQNSAPTLRLAKYLSECGTLTTINAYRTTTNHSNRSKLNQILARQNNIHWVIFCSPSAVGAFFKLLKPDYYPHLNHIKIATIGQTTHFSVKQKLPKNCKPVVITVADPPGLQNIVHTMLQFDNSF